MSDERKATRLPGPPMLALVKMNEMEVAEMIERHINYVDGEGRSVHLPMPFVRHFMKRDDSLPRVYGFSQLPIMLPDGTLLTGGGLDRKYGIIFRVADDLNALMPEPTQCTDEAVAEAMRFLCDDWLVDVAGEYADRCIVVALCLTIIERMLLPERPCFFITAGKRGSGKTTTLHMVSRAVLGHEAVAAAWSPNEEERRKALFAYLDTGLPLLIWDNLAKGSMISCPSIEKALTTEIYSDRVLGVSEIRRVPAYTIQCFTGNNINPFGDMASRALCARLGTERPDPENREFKHADPITWTLKHRGSILQAMYTILMGNPRRAKGRDRTAAETRFKEWWDLIGSAVEHAADLHHNEEERKQKKEKEQPVRFKEMFLQSEEANDESVGAADVLRILYENYPEGFQSSQIANALKNDDVFAGGGIHEWAGQLRAGLEQVSGRLLRGRDISTTVVTWRLKGMVNMPVRVGKDDVLVLHFKPDHQGGVFIVESAARGTET